MLSKAAAVGADAFLTGEATYHQCLEAKALGIALIMIGHHASEAFSMAVLAARLQTQLDAAVDVWMATSTKQF